MFWARFSHLCTNTQKSPQLVRPLKFLVGHFEVMRPKNRPFIFIQKEDFKIWPHCQPRPDIFSSQIAKSFPLKPIFPAPF